MSVHLNRYAWRLRFFDSCVPLCTSLLYCWNEREGSRNPRPLGGALLPVRAKLTLAETTS